MNWIDRLIEEKIREAEKRGEFRDLPGKGKPLDLEENPFEPMEERLANRLLKQNDIRPAWLEEWMEIEIERHRLAEALAQGGIAERKQAARQMAGDVETLNRRISDFNLGAPLPEFQHRRFVIPRELMEG